VAGKAASRKRKKGSSAQTSKAHSRDGTPAQTKRRPRRPSTERRAEILEAARREFIRLGYRGATFRKIAEAADVNEAMLFRFFQTKDRLYEEAVAAPLEEAINHAFAPVADDVEVREISETFVKELLEAMEDIAPMLIAVLGDEERGLSFYQRRFEPAVERMVEQIKGNLDLWDHREFNPDLAFRAVVGICLFVALDERFGKRHHGKPAELAPELLSIVWDGLRARSS
jgi:AcrR family transcriptional regulator